MYAVCLPNATRRCSLATVAVALLSSCDEPFQTDLEQVQFHDIVRNITGSLISRDKIAAGSRLCLEPTEWQIGGESGSWDMGKITSCFELFIGSPGETSRRTDQCIDVGTTAVERVVDLAPKTCWHEDGRAIEFSHDTIHFDVRAIDSLEPFMPEEQILDELSPAPDTDFPEQWLSPGTAPFRVVAPGAGRLYFRPLDSEGDPISWTGEAIPFVAEAANTEISTIFHFENDSYGVAALTYANTDGDLASDANLALTAYNGASAGLSEMSRITLVQESTIARLNLVPLYRNEGPAYIRAIARNMQGERLHAALVEWEVPGGEIALEALDGDLASGRGDVVEVLGFCNPPERPEQRTSVVIGRVNGIEESVVLEWQASSADEESVFADCLAGCACRVRSGSGQQPFALLLLLPLFRIRRSTSLRRR